MKLNLKLLIASLIAGILALVAEMFIYSGLENVVSRPVLIAIMLTVLALFVVATLFVMSVCFGDSQEDFFFLDGKGPILIGLVVALVVLFFAGMGLEAIYDSDKVTFATPTSYIFVLDESGSMFGNDADGLRYTAVNTMMQTVADSTPYAVYVFADSTACAREMAPFSQGSYVVDEAIINSVGGGTAIAAALKTVLDDYYAGKFATGGSAIRVILLSDGSSFDIVSDSDTDFLQEYRSNGICISTVGLGYDDPSTMKRIAKKTGGSYIHIDNAQELSQGFNYAATTSADRDLFSERNIVSNELLYGVLRVLFLTLLGAIIVVMKAAAVGSPDSHWLIMIAGWIGAFVGALLVEILTLFGVGIGVGVSIYCLLVAITPVLAPVIRERSFSTDSYYNV